MTNLIQARVRVTWGKTNLSSYAGSLDFPEGHPLVYDVEVNMQSETQGPTATMKWDPTGAGMRVYESFLKDEELMATPIVIEYFYPTKKKIIFRFIWTGQSINYGNDMTITVKMQSELAGLINANLRSIAQADTSKAGVNGINAISYVQKEFGLTQFPNLVTYTERAKKDLAKAKLSTNYGNDMTFGGAIGNLAQQTGNMAFASNIWPEPTIVLYTPFTWDKEAVVYNGVTELPVGENPDPAKRYGYLLGPSLINSMTRSTEWKPPQLNQKNTPATQTLASPPQNRLGANAQAVPPAPQTNVSNTRTPTRAPVGTSNGRSTPGVGNKDNPDQVPKQDALNAEKTSDLNLTTYLVPALVGIKPHDIIYIPSYKGDYIEDWIVQGIDYNEDNGKVELGIQATRVYGLGTPMNEKAAEKFKTFAITNGLVGPNWTLEAWERYAWMSEDYSQPRGTPPAG